MKRPRCHVWRWEECGVPPHPSHLGRSVEAAADKRKWITLILPDSEAQVIAFGLFMNAMIRVHSH